MIRNLSLKHNRGDLQSGQNWMCSTSIHMTHTCKCGSPDSSHPSWTHYSRASCLLQHPEDSRPLSVLRGMMIVIIIMYKFILIIINGEVTRCICTHKMYEALIVFIFKSFLWHNPRPLHIILSNMHALAFIRSSSLILSRVVS